VVIVSSWLLGTLAPHPISRGGPSAHSHYFHPWACLSEFMDQRNYHVLEPQQMLYLLLGLHAVLHA